MAFILPLTEIASAPGAKPIAARPANGGVPPVFRLRGRFQVCAYGRVKDAEKEERVIRVSDPLKEGVALPHLFPVPLLQGASPPPPPPPSPPPLEQQKQTKESTDEKQNYYVNLGYAIRTLREEFPDIFQREPSFDIYRDDIVFRDPLNTFVGIKNYKTIFSLLRFSGRIFFKAIWISIASVWQPVENVIMIRWTVHGNLRVPWDCHSRFDATSEYKLDKNGKIYEHRVHKIASNPPTRFQVLPVEELIQLLSCPSTPKPTCFETSISNSISCNPMSLRLAWIRYYLAFRITLSLKCTAKD